MMNPEPPPARPFVVVTRIFTTLGATRLTTAVIVLEYESSNSSSDNKAGELSVTPRLPSLGDGLSESKSVLIEFCDGST